MPKAVTTLAAIFRAPVKDDRNHSPIGTATSLRRLSPLLGARAGVRENTPHDLTHDYNTEEHVELGDASGPAEGFLEESEFPTNI